MSAVVEVTSMLEEHNKNSLKSSFPLKWFYIPSGTENLFYFLSEFRFESASLLTNCVILTKSPYLLEPLVPSVKTRAMVVTVATSQNWEGSRTFFLQTFLGKHLAQVPGPPVGRSCDHHHRHLIQKPIVVIPG